MGFRNRESAARRLADRLAPLRGQAPLILAIPRGAVPMGRVLADRLDGDLDVVLVRKLGAPGNPELAVGALCEDGTVSVAPHADASDLPAGYLEEEAAHQLAVLCRRRVLYTPHRSPIDPAGRIVVVVDDGVATGATMEAALCAVRAARPRRLIAAMAVAPPETVARLSRLADDVVCLETPSRFWAVGQFFEDFRQVSDEEVVALLAAGDGRPVSIDLPRTRLAGLLAVPPDPCGLVIFAHGSGSSRLSPRNRFVAARLARNGFATLLCDLLSEDEDRRYDTRFNIPLLSERLEGVTAWAARQDELSSLPVGYFGASTGTASALAAAAALGATIAAVVSRGGRPDLALTALPEVVSPTLFIVGERDPQVLELNRLAQRRLAAESSLEIVPGATHLFEEPGALERVADLATWWFREHLAARPGGEETHPRARRITPARMPSSASR